MHLTCIRALEFPKVHDRAQHNIVSLHTICWAVSCAEGTAQVLHAALRADMALSSIDH